MKLNILTLQVILLMLAVSIAGCNITAKTDDIVEENGEFDFANIEKGTGKIEFRGKSYPLNESFSGKMTSWYPPPLEIFFYDSVIPDNPPNNPNNIRIIISNYLYSTWTSLELPVGTYEDITHELALDNYGIQGYSTLDKMFNTKMVVKKSGNNYEITLTGKTKLYLEDDGQLEDYKMIWKGGIKVNDGNLTKEMCEDMKIFKVFNDEPAIVKKGSFYQLGTADEFYFELVNQDYDFLFSFPGVVPLGDIPEQYREEGLSVYISGNVTNCVIGGGTYHTRTRFIPIFLFELKSIKINNY